MKIPNKRKLQQTTRTYPCPLVKVFEKQINTIKQHGLKQTEAMKD